MKISEIARKVAFGMVTQCALFLLSQCAIASFSSLAMAADFPQTITIGDGKLTGVASANGEVTSFKGIPYAAPPTGALRFAPPSPALKWSATLNADHFSASCIQAIAPTDVEPGSSPYSREFNVDGPVSEDCLYLNVWTPAKSKANRLPVMVYFYGGGFFAGSASLPILDAEGLAGKGVVVVTLNYRLGLLGFLASPELDRESPHKVSGNYGILDQIAALQWVSRNIQAFGGDPGRVTIFGQSAGGGSVHFLSLSPLARGLFQRAIVESATMHPQDPLLHRGAMSYKKLGEAEELYRAYLRKAGVDSVAALRAMTAGQILALPPAPFPPAFFCPLVDGYVLPFTFSESYAQSKQADVPIMIGGNAEDLGSRPVLSTTLTGYKSWAQNKFGPLSDQFLQLYPASTDGEAGVAENLAIHDQNVISKILWAEAFGHGTRAPIYLYLWNHPLPGLYATKFGAFHTSEVPYVMSSLAKVDRPFTADDRKIAATMSQYWANFAARGNPNGDGLPAWPEFRGSGKTMQLGDGFRPLDPEPAKERVEFFKRYFALQPSS